MNLLKPRGAVQSGQRLENYRIGLSPKSLMVMNLPDDRQWDETTCDQAVCQHPQCWASVRRIERGHPRIMRVPGKSLEAEEKLPMLTIVNVSDSGLQTKRLAHPRLSHLPLRKTCSSLSRGSKLKSKHPSRPQSLPDKNAMNQIEFPKLSILNLNGTELPCSEVARNMVVVWIPKDVEKRESSAEKTPDLGHRKKAKEKLPGVSLMSSLILYDTTLLGLFFFSFKVSPSYSSPDSSLNEQICQRNSFLRNNYYASSDSFSLSTPWGKESWPPGHLSIGLKSPVATVPPPSTPVCMLEKWTSESALDGVPQDLLKESLLPDLDKDELCPEMKIQLTMMKKNLPLKKTRPDSAISSKMFLTVHRLTLQKRSLQQSEHLKKWQKKEGFLKKQLPQVPHQAWHQPQKWKAKSPAKKQRGQKLEKCKDLQELENPEEEAKSDSMDHKISSHTTPQGWESNLELEQMEKRGASRLDSISQPMMDDFDYLDFISTPESPDLSDVEYTQEEYSSTDQETKYSHIVSSPMEQEMQHWSRESSSMKQETEYSHREATPMEQDVSEVRVVGQETAFTHFSESPSERCWNPELKLLRIIQAAAEEEEENSASLPPSEESVEI
ncbi:uncharacterized protein C9orf43 homolog [Perognathus longimembris pacificus]|uniref:uncharacterized protein C9orf43 homolog n=1 Tax=Perognathus longimembris pacificus TaxID=214514 RepID=UPI00201935E2|nr:uncharacterized protein C9orf43 homolog [Perognathus longimembris pacificus]